jgi:hypothetical protein
MAQKNNETKTHENARDNMAHKRQAFDQEHDLKNMNSEEKESMHEGYAEMGSKGGKKRAEELGHEGYQDMGHMGGVKRAENLAHKR